MESDSPLPRNPLLPNRHEIPDFFVCDIFDATPKSDQASMAHPMFTLSTKPDFTPREYWQGDTFVKIDPSAKGLATVHDKDLLIYAVSQCMARLQRGLKVEKKLRFHPHDVMIMTNRETTGGSYKRFRDTLYRLRNTAIETNIQMGGRERLDGFGFIDDYSIVRETRDGRMQLVEITLSDWLFDAIDVKGKELLTISPGYFRLRKPLERRLYELARKHCGKSPKWQIGFTKLLAKTGSRSTPYEFARMIDNIVQANNAHDHLPDYRLEIIKREKKDDLAVFRPRAEFLNAYLPDGDAFDANGILLSADARDAARKFAAGYSLDFLEHEWRKMLTEKQSKPDNPTGSYVGYVKWYVKENGPARR